MFQGSVEENVLGITWNNQLDVLSFKVNFELINRIIEAEQRQPEIKLTKRLLLSQIARIYDPVSRRVPYKGQDWNASSLANWS